MRKILVFVAVSLVLFPAAAGAGIAIEFDFGGRATATPGSVVILTGSLGNSGQQAVPLSPFVTLSAAFSPQIPVNPQESIVADLSASANFLPNPLNPGQIYSGPLMSLNISGQAAPGDYSGIFYLIDSSTSSPVAAAYRDFYLHVASGPSGSGSPLSVGLQMPSGLLYQEPKEPVFPGGPRLIRRQGSDTVFWVSPANQKIPMLSREVFLSYGNRDNDVSEVSEEELGYYPDAKFIWLNGQGAIFQIEGQTKRQIPSRIWNVSGFGADSVISVNRQDFDSYRNGKSITQAEELRK